MSVYDKELTIDGREVRSPEQQVWKNMKDIKKLKEKIKDAYKCIGELNTESIAIARSLTNVPEGVESGWLLDPVGSLFAITGSDEDSLLISFYCSIRGPQGEDGAALNIDDTITSVNKVWSSKKTDDEIKGLIDDDALLPETTKTWSINKISSLLSSGVAWTTTDAVGGVMSLENIYIGADTVEDPTLSSPKLKPKDIVLYVNNEGACEKIYYVSSTTSNAASVTKMCDVGGGKQLYSHNIFYKTTDTVMASILIISDRSSAYDFSSFCSYLKSNGMTFGSNNLLPCSGVVYVSSNIKPLIGVSVNGDSELKFMYTDNANNLSNQYSTFATIFNDKVITL